MQDDLFGRIATHAMERINAAGMYDALSRLELKVCPMSRLKRRREGVREEGRE